MTREETDIFNGRAERLAEYRDQIATLTAERETLLKDKAQLDWLEEVDADVQRMTGEWRMFAPGVGAFYGETLRAAIDAAMGPKP